MQRHSDGPRRPRDARAAGRDSCDWLAQVTFSQDIPTDCGLPDATISGQASDLKFEPVADRPSGAPAPNFSGGQYYQAHEGTVAIAFSAEYPNGSCGSGVCHEDGTMTLDVKKGEIVVWMALGPKSKRMKIDAYAYIPDDPPGITDSCSGPVSLPVLLNQWLETACGEMAPNSASDVFTGSCDVSEDSGTVHYDWSLTHGLPVIRAS